MTIQTKINKRKEDITMDFNDNYFDDDCFEDDYLDENDSEDCDEFLKFAVGVYESYLESVSEDDFVVNPPQMRKFIEIVKFFSRKVKKENFEIEPILFSKKDCSAEVTIRGIVLSLYLSEVAEFCSLAKDSCNIYLETNLKNEICLTILFTDVFVEKNEFNHTM